MTIKKLKLIFFSPNVFQLTMIGKIWQIKKTMTEKIIKLWDDPQKLIRALKVVKYLRKFTFWPLNCYLVNNLVFELWEYESDLEFYITVNLLVPEL